MQRYKKGERNCKYVWVVFRLCSELHFLLGNVMVEKNQKKVQKNLEIEKMCVSLQPV